MTTPPGYANETCPCGAYLNIGGLTDAQLKTHLEAFRKAHAVCREKQTVKL